MEKLNAPLPQLQVRQDSLTAKLKDINPSL